MKRQTAETALVKACLHMLALVNIPAWRQNTGAIQVGKRFVRFGEKGVSDILGVLPPSGRLLAVECKIRPRKPTADQSAFLANVNAAGGLGILVYDLNDLRAALDEVYP